MRSCIVNCLLTYAAFTTANPIEKRALGTATVSLALPSGVPQQLGSGILYGVPINEDGSANTDIPDVFYTDIGYNYGRAGGAQWPAPNRGFSWGPAEYTYRFNSTLSNYRTARRYGASFFLLPHDIWGIDFQPAPNGLPGDNGDWTAYDAFLTQLISDIRANDMLPGLVWDTWNEPDIESFWPRSQEQYREMWARTYARLRTDLPEVLISGPATSGSPDATNSPFNDWAAFVVVNGSVPDIYTWHSLDGSRAPVDEVAYFDQLRDQLGLPAREININEYLALPEEGPGLVMWYLGQLERAGVRGCKANWQKVGLTVDTLHNVLANILGPVNHTGPYYPNGEWQLYKYYAGMRGQRVATSSSADKKFEVFSTVENGFVKVLAATRGTTDSYSITLTGFGAVGLSGQVSLKIRAFTWNGVVGEVGDPQDLGSSNWNIVDDQITVDVFPRTTQEAYAFELSQA